MKTEKRTYTKSRDDDLYFDNPAEVSSVKVKKTDWTVEGGSVTNFTVIKKTISGIEYAIGVEWHVEVVTKKWATVMGTGGGGYWIDPIPSTIEVTIYYEPSAQASSDSETADDISDEDKETLKWIEQMVIRQAGINRKCSDIYDIQDRGHGVKRATENIILSMIPDEAAADNIGEIAIYNSYRNSGIDISTVPNFNLASPGELFTFDLSKIDKYGMVERITGVTFDDMDFIISTEIEA